MVQPEIQVKSNYLDDLSLEIPKSKLYGRIRELEAKLKYQNKALNLARKSAIKANKEKSRTATLLIVLRNEGKLSMTDMEIADRCFITKKSIIETKCKIKRAAK